MGTNFRSVGQRIPPNIGAPNMAAVKCLNHLCPLGKGDGNDKKHWLSMRQVLGEITFH